MKKFSNYDDFISYKKDSKEEKIEILVGMGSCGIAAGAKKVIDVLEKEIEKRGLNIIELKITGCLGLCFSEPNVEVKVPGLPDILYGKVNEKFAVRIIEEHIANKSIINENIYDKPYIDILPL